MGDVNEETAKHNALEEAKTQLIAAINARLYTAGNNTNAPGRIVFHTKDFTVTQEEGAIKLTGKDKKEVQLVSQWLLNAGLLRDTPLSESPESEKLEIKFDMLNEDVCRKATQKLYAQIVETQKVIAEGTGVKDEVGDAMQDPHHGVLSVDNPYLRLEQIKEMKKQFVAIEQKTMQEIKQLEAKAGVVRGWTDRADERSSPSATDTLRNGY